MRRQRTNPVYGGLLGSNSSSIRSALFLILTLMRFANAFVSPAVRNQHISPTLPQQQQQQQQQRNFSPFRINARYNKINNEHNNIFFRLSMVREAPEFKDSSSDSDDDDDDEVSLDTGDDADWRSFRAKLVMSENQEASSKAAKASNSEDKSDAESKASSAASSSTTTTTETSSSSTDDDSTMVVDDVDGIGALFMDQTEFVSSSSSSSSEEKKQQTKTTKMTPLDPSQWAYDSGKVIEQGAVILGGVEQDYGFGLRQQYFHKAAILVLDHEDATFTKGIILNRPSDLLLDDDVNVGVKWRVWFGGDVQGIDSAMPSIVCLHSLKGKRAKQASVPVMKDIQWTSFDNAKKLVKVGAASPTDFWVFAGYAGWGPGQLMGELDRKSWYMVATDSQTLLQELARQAAGADPRDAGLETWDLLMNMIGRGETAEEHSGDGDFDDLMLKEWALKHLLSTEAGGGAGDKRRVPEGLASTQEFLGKDPVDRLLNRVTAAARGEDIAEGSLVRASPADRSPFLLDDQELHKSVILILSDNESITVGAILNRPAARGVDIQTTEQETGKSSAVTLPLRYGGQYAVKGSEPLLWLHCNAVLRAAKIGSPFGVGTPNVKQNGIWKCTGEDALRAVSRGLASSSDFMIISGVSVWTNGERGVARGMQGEIRAGRFEMIPDEKIESVWNVLSKQEVLTDVNLVQSIAIAEEAWREGGAASSSSNNKKKKDDDRGTPPPIGGLGEGYDEEDDTLVFKSDVKVSNLSDNALLTWISTFLLRAPSLG